MRQNSKPILHSNKQSGSKVFDPMKMQTGPAVNQSMNNWLAWTGCMELVNIAVFSGLLWELHFLFPHAVAELSLLGVMTLNVVLLQGGLYWLFKRMRFLKAIPAIIRLYILVGLYILMSIIMCVFPTVVIVRLLLGYPLGLADVIIGVCYYLFGVGEFIHYFWFKINMRHDERQAMLQERKLVTARLLREYRQVRKEIGRSN